MQKTAASLAATNSKRTRYALACRNLVAEGCIHWTVSLFIYLAVRCIAVGINVVNQRKGTATSRARRGGAAGGTTPPDGLYPMLRSLGGTKNFLTVRREYNVFDEASFWLTIRSFLKEIGNLHWILWEYGSGGDVPPRHPLVPPDENRCPLLLRAHQCRIILSCRPRPRVP